MTGEFSALAVMNRTTNAIAHSGIWRNIILGLIHPILGFFFCAFLSMFLGKFAYYIYLLFPLYSIVLFWRAIATSLAVSEVKAAEGGLLSVP